MDPSRPRNRTIEDVCSIHGQRGRDVPPLRPDLVPNFSEIRKVYDTFFAPGLDHVLETGYTKWFALKGFDLLTSDRSLLAQFMLYLTLISNTPNAGVSGPVAPEQAALASQEARMTWSLLNLCVRQAQEGNDEDAEKFARRVKALEALLTSEPVVRTGSMSDFVHQEPDNETDIEMVMEGIPTVANNPLLEKPFMKQLAARSDEFWQLIEKASEHPTTIPIEIFDQARALLDGQENRDIIYSIMLLGSLPKFHENNGRLDSESNNSSPSRAARRQEKEQAARLLETEANGRATNMVLQNLAGMGLRAFVS
ncbi:hypothetical protein H2198_000439 [Neophaeococcomyces mojaviensis]|uniref:Uncharacterized protein n=1 Tax=Neophaeococcomyces mojaviensis TaxID=3383035 RepID=A0ACC3AKI2_9EURO|nr:hypothetical protein H2198_000439 [Knufia sp. JES_112]